MKKVELFVNNSESIAQCNSPNYSIGSPNDHFEKEKKGSNPMILILGGVWFLKLESHLCLSRPHEIYELLGSKKNSMDNKSHTLAYWGKCSEVLLLQ